MKKPEGSRFSQRATGLLLWAAASVGVGTAGLATVATMAGCLKLLAEKPLEPGSYGSSEKELLRLWQDVLEAAKRDDRDKLTEMMSSMRMSPQELSMLIGDDKARRYWPRYELLARPLSGAGAAELVGSIYEHHYDDVEVTRVDNLPPEKQSESEQGMMRALVSPTPFYRVRVVKKGTPYAIRYDFFVYLHGYWKTGRDLGKFVNPPKIAPLVLPGTPPATSQPTESAAPAESRSDAGIGAAPKETPAPAAPAVKVEVKTKAPG